MNLKNKTVVITGGSQGLGFSIAQLLVKKGAQVHIISRSVDNLNQADKKIKSKNLFLHQGDVSSYSQIEKIINKISKIDILINNAGLWLSGPFTKQDATKIDQLIDVNTKGTIFTTKAVLPEMLKKNKGHIINVSSTSGLKGRANETTYAASKFAVQGFTEALKVELSETDIKISGFYPGGMNTKFFEKAGTPKQNKDWMNTDKVAEILIFMLEQDSSMIMDHVVLNKRKPSA